VARKKAQLDIFNRTASGDQNAPPPITDASLTDEAQRRYLHYALSVITARALPDVRDGLKPVQRRILFTMHHDLHLRHDAKSRKCAAIVGDVMGKYHPHGDSALYEALVRMAQSFTLRAPLVDGRGNFGSPDGDSAAAMRYTEAKLQKLAGELLNELSKQTVRYRPSYDGTRFEPIVLPARFPNLLVNGVQGIAVGMATSIPPHNLGEVIDATVALIDDGDITVAGLLKHIKGPDFPTGGQLLCERAELRTVYETGQGGLKLRGEWKLEEGKQRAGDLIVIYSIPYAVKRGALVEKIAEVIIAKKLPALVDVRDESTDDTRVVLEIKKGTDPQLVMSYLYKHTPLQSSVAADFTCLVPTDNPDVAGPARIDLKTILRHFLDFRMEVVTKRLQYELDQLVARIHVLEGLAIIFDALDETIRIIRRSKGKQDAADKLMERFKLDELQVDAILELKLYRLAQLEILLIQEELGEKRKEAARLDTLLKNTGARWKLIRAELLELKGLYPDRRRTRIVGQVDEPEYDAQAFILEEDAHVLLTRQGWIKRQREVNVESTRMRDGDEVLDVAVGSTKSVIALFSNQGTCYVCRINDVPASTGYGAPVQKLFKLADGERIVRMLGFDARVLDVPAVDESSEEPKGPYVIGVTKQGMCLSVSLRAHREPSTRSGRRFMRLGDADEVIYVGLQQDGANLACASEQGRALICEASEVALLGGPGKGVKLIKLDDGDVLIGAQLLYRPSDALVVEKESGTSFMVSTRKYQPVSRGGKGHVMFKQGKLKSWLPPAPEVPKLPEPS
jgi:DNA gyrase subunit A